MKNILVGITGGIAAYKSCELVRLLTKAGYNIKVVMTNNAQNFIHPNTYAALSNNTVHTDTFADPMAHIDLAKWADKIIIAPATAAIIAKLAQGAADDLLTTICLATTAPIYIAPAMNQQMWANSFTQQNISKLRAHNFNFIGPATGSQACGDVGLGRMSEPEAILRQLITPAPLTNLRVLITAGGTQEKIDPVRYIGNYSSGKMGYAVAREFINQGAQVTLISGPTCLPAPPNCNFITVTSAAEMHQSVHKEINNKDIFICAAAIADYKPTHYCASKTKKKNASLTLALSKTIDILYSLRQTTDVVKIGFCAETDNLLTNAQHKLLHKNLDAIIANKVSTAGYPFNADTNQVVYISKDGHKHNIGPASKQAIATEIVTLVTTACRQEPA